MSIRIGINPITWTNDDVPELGGDTPLETCLSEMAEAGYRGTELTFSFALNSRAHLTASAQFAERRSLITVTNDDFEYFSVAWTRDLGRATMM